MEQIRRIMRPTDVPDAGTLINVASFSYWRKYFSLINLCNVCSFYTHLNFVWKVEGNNDMTSFGIHDIQFYDYFEFSLFYLKLHLISVLHFLWMATSYLIISLNLFLSLIWFLLSSGLLCDLLWSDPDKEITGWGENDRGVSFTFGADVVGKFLNRHDLDLICRAHQVWPSLIRLLC